MQTTKEGKTIILIPEEEKISKSLSIFYNPRMRLNRDITIALLKTKENLRIALPLAGTGVRALRILKECPKSTSYLFVNDANPKLKQTLHQGIINNKIKKEQQEKIKISINDANQGLLDQKGFDYIDIDPFGTPNPFLDSAIKRLNRKGILAVTATDTAPLCGVYPKACKRKYYSEPEHGPNMQEIGLRILIRKIQLIGAQYDLCLRPILSYCREHYFRIYFEARKGKTLVDNILAKHGMDKNAGPIWKGDINDTAIVEEIMTNAVTKESKKLLEQIFAESFIKTIRLIDVHEICSKEKTKCIPKYQKIIDILKQKGHDSAISHHRDSAIRTTATRNEVKEAIFHLI